MKRKRDQGLDSECNRTKPPHLPRQNSPTLDPHSPIVRKTLSKREQLVSENDSSTAWSSQQREDSRPPDLLGKPSLNASGQQQVSFPTPSHRPRFFPYLLLKLYHKQSILRPKHGENNHLSCQHGSDCSRPPHLRRSLASQDLSSVGQASPLASTALSTSPVIPLTRANLNLIDPTMPPQTPSKTSKSQPTITESNSVRDAIRLLEERHILINNSDARDANETFLDQVLESMETKRGTHPGAESMQKIKTTFELHKNDNEATFLVEFWDELIKKARTVQPDLASPPEVKYWVDDDLSLARDQQFRGDCVPSVKAFSKSEEKLLEDLPKVTKPKPDICYGMHRGLAKNWLTPAQIAVVDKHARFTLPGQSLILPHCVVEGKSIDGKPAEGNVQASRGGTTCTASFRKLDEMAGTAFTGTGPDPRSYAFSVVLSPEFARLNVHWIQLEKGAVVNYQNHTLKWYMVEQKSSWRDIRNDVHNILDYGATKRKTMIAEMLSRIEIRDNMEGGVPPPLGGPAEKGAQVVEEISEDELGSI
ncbi:MAG: hypothetical protein Q9218_003113 [Villophora microphyllina]